MVLSVEVLTLIALWCSNPAYTKLSNSQVNSCREQLISCISQSKDAAAKTKCVTEQKL